MRLTGRREGCDDSLSDRDGPVPCCVGGEACHGRQALPGGRGSGVSGEGGQRRVCAGSWEKGGCAEGGEWLCSRPPGTLPGVHRRLPADSHLV